MIKNIVCAMSGGVDSAVAALLLKQKGFNVTGVFMRNWDLTNEQGTCSVDKDCEDATLICRHIGIPFREVNFTREYWNDVFSEMVEGYTSGLTPNPDVLCNKYIKFGRLFNYAVDELGADAVATGHYARNSAGQFLQRLTSCSEGVKLLTACDQSKDQTLFLSQISQHALHRSMFPVGGLLKANVKQMALEAGLHSIVKKRESVGICFIGTRCFKDFIEQYVEPASGEFVDVDTGEVVGRHRGVHYWTIGQRALIPGLSKAYFVCARDSNSQIIHVASGTDHPALFSDSLITGPFHWIRQPVPQLDSNLRKRTCNNSASLKDLNSDSDSSKNETCEPLETVSLQFRFQHTHPLIGCRVSLMANNEFCLLLDEPIRALAAGQYAVLYKDGVECLGSAQIVRVGPTMREVKQGNVKSSQNFISVRSR